MEALKQIISFFTPSSVSCNDRFDSEFPNDQSVIYEDVSPVHGNQKRKVPGFQHILNPVLMVTGENQFIKGFRFECGFPLSEYFLLNQTWDIPNSGVKENVSQMQMMMGRTPSKPTYTLTAQVVQDITSPQEAPGIIMMGKTDNEGRKDAIFLKKLNKNWNLKLSGNFHSSKFEDGALGVDLEYENSDCVSIAKLSHSIQGVTGTLNYMQRITDKVMLGFQYMNLISHKKSLFSYGAKCFIGNHSVYGAYMHGGSQIHLGYMIPIKKGATFVSHFKQDPESGSQVTCGFKQRYNDIQVSTTATSNLKFLSILNIKTPMFGVKLCAEADYLKDHYTFGYGISVGQNQ